MLYEHLTFPTPDGRPFVFANFAMTLDGKVAVLGDPAYQPFTSALDHQTMLELRMCADVLVHGRQTAIPARTLDSLRDESFRKARAKRTSRPLTYLIVSNAPAHDLVPVVSDPPENVHVVIATNESATLPRDLEQAALVLRVGANHVDLSALCRALADNGCSAALLEGGPHLMAGFFREELIDELFLTLAPKIFGNRGGRALTMVEGYLFAPENAPRLELLSYQEVESELFLRYRVIHSGHGRAAETRPSF